MKLGSILDPIDSILGKFISNPSEKIAALGEIEKIFQGPILAQLGVAAQEAQHASIFVAGARPFILWVCGTGFLYQFIVRDLLAWAMAIGWPELIPPPSLDTGPLMTLAAGMLGLGTMRTIEGVKGVKRNKL